MSENGNDRSVLAAHVDECEECRADALRLDRVATLLNRSVVRVDVAALSQRTLSVLQPELAHRARAVLLRRAATAVGLALLPLPLVLVYDAYLLDALYQISSMLLPAAVAAYLVFTYVAFLGLLFGGTYAAIPLLVARHGLAAATTPE
jgi:anti-sigma factor RsiW